MCESCDPPPVCGCEGEVWVRGKEGNSAESGRSEGACEGDSSSASRPWTARLSPVLLGWRPDMSGRVGERERESGKLKEH